MSVSVGGCKKQWYHGSGTRITEFSEAFLGLGNEQHGSGFYFTNDRSEAHGYATHRLDGLEKPGGEDNPSIMTVKIETPDHQLIKGDEVITAIEIRKIIWAGLDRSNDKESYLASLGNFADIEYEGLQSAVDNAVEAYDLEEILPVLYSISNDLFRHEEGLFLRIASEVTGYRGVLAENANGTAHVIAWLPEDINIVQAHSIGQEATVTPKTKTRNAESSYQP